MKSGSGVICESWAPEVAVIPAKAGIHSANLRSCAVYKLDSRFRGNDWCFEMDPTPNDTTTLRRVRRLLGGIVDGILSEENTLDSHG